MNYTDQFYEIKKNCLLGHKENIDLVLAQLSVSVDLPTTRAVDLYLGMVNNKEGIKQIEHYLFNGTQIQRNYCTLFFARKNNWPLVNKAYHLGLVDKIQAYSR